MCQSEKEPQAKAEAEQCRSPDTAQLGSRHAAILEVIALAAPGLMKTTDLVQNINGLLARLGQCTSADRVYIFENQMAARGSLRATLRHSWTAPSVSASGQRSEGWDFLILDVGLRRWAEQLGSDMVLHGSTDAFPSNERRMLKAYGIKTVLIVPIQLKGSWWGFIGFDKCRNEEEWSPGEIDAIRAVADVIAAALENAELHQEAEARAKQLAALRDASQAVGGTLAQDTILSVTLEHVCILCGAARGTAYLADLMAGVAVPQVVVGLPESHYAGIPALPLEESLTGQVIVAGRALFIERGVGAGPTQDDDVDANALSDSIQLELPTRYAIDHEGAFVAKAAAFIPLSVGEHVLGTLNLAFETPRQFSGDERQLLIAIGQQAGIALANARLFQETVAAENKARRRANQLAALHEIDQAINSSLEPTAVYSCIVEQAVGLLDCQVADLLLWDAVTQKVTHAATHPAIHTDDDLTDRIMSLAENPIVYEMASSRAPVAIADTLADSGASRAWREGRAAHALLATPLISRDQTIGFLVLMDQKGPRHWRDDEITVLGQLAGQAAVAIGNARLFDTEQRTRQTAETLQETARIVNASLDLKQTLDLLLEQLAKLVKYDSAALFLRQDGMLYVAAGRGFPDLQAVMQLRIEVSEDALLSEIIEKRQPVVLSDARHDERFHGWGNTQYVSGWIGVPLLLGRELVGILTIDSRTPDAYDDESARLAQALADHTTVAIFKTRLLDELQQANRELRELDELKGQFIQNVAHELRTPLTLVRGYIELLAQGNLSLETQQEAIRTAMKYTHALVQLVESITSIQNLSMGELAVDQIDPPQLVEMALQLASQKALRSGIEIYADCPSDLPPLSGDFTWLSQALYQLIDNAIKFSPGGDAVVVKVSGLPTDRELQISVEDQGIGVPADAQERIFELFYQADGTTTRRFGGTGLGLAIVQRVVQAHGGRVWVESPIHCLAGDQNPGSRFIIRLPCNVVSPPIVTI